jgi:hypothetical protein
MPGRIFLHPRCKLEASAAKKGSNMFAGEHASVFGKMGIKQVP